jgi:hypothetical protein
MPFFAEMLHALSDLQARVEGIEGAVAQQEYSS